MLNQHRAKYDERCIRTWGSYLDSPVAALVDESTKFHHIPDDAVEDDVVAYIDAVIGMFAVNAGCDRLNGRGRRKSFTDSTLNICLKLVGGCGIGKLRFNVVESLLELHTEEWRGFKPKLS